MGGGHEVYVPLSQVSFESFIAFREGDSNTQYSINTKESYFYSLKVTKGKEEGEENFVLSIDRSS